MIDDEVAQILRSTPEFADRFMDLVESADDDPGAAAVFVELGDFVAGLLAAVEQVRPTLERCLAGLEAVAAGSSDAEELIVWSFFDGLSPDEVRLLGPWLGPRTRALLDDADRSPPVAAPYRVD